MTEPAKRPKRIYPIESFGPDLLAALLKGAKERVEVTLPSWKSGARMQLRLQQLRFTMQRLNDELWPIVARTKISLLWGLRAGFEDTPAKHARGTPRPINPLVPCKIILEPRDSEFIGALHRAGVMADELKVDPLEAPLVEEFAPTEPPRTGFFDRIHESIKKPAGNEK